MEKLSSVLQRTFPTNSPPPQMAGGTEFDWAAYEKRRAEWFNAAPGERTGYDCPKCHNRGGFMAIEPNGALVHRPCVCAAIREAQAAMRQSGLPMDTLQDCTFDQWETPEKWQQEAVKLAREYADHGVNVPGFSAWFIMSGPPGSGKTRLCSTVFRFLVEHGIEGRYFSWRDFSRQAKAVTNDADRFAKLIRQAKRPALVYMDDFWKGSVTPADVHLAFELLNDRYAAGKMTVLSSELTIEAIIRGDEAIGSRLFEMSNGFYVNCSQAKNWRTRAGARPRWQQWAARRGKEARE